MSDLTKINGIGASVAKALQDQGIDTATDLANADPDEIDVPTGNADTLVRRANQSTIVSKSMADILNEYEEQTFEPTGVDGLDDILGGGFESETVGMIYGPSGQGKTQLAFSGMAQSASEGSSVAYLQTEVQSKAVADRVASMIEDPNDLTNISMYEAYTPSDMIDTYSVIADRSEGIDLFIVDSFTGPFRVGGEFDGRQNLSERSEVMGIHLDRLRKIAQEKECAVVLVGQVYQTPEAYAKGDRLWGGDKLEHFCSYFVKMSSGSGTLVEGTLENHVGKAERTITLSITDEGLVEKVE